MRKMLRECLLILLSIFRYLSFSLNRIFILMLFVTDSFPSPVIPQIVLTFELNTTKMDLNRMDQLLRYIFVKGNCVIILLNDQTNYYKSYIILCYITVMNYADELAYRNMQEITVDLLLNL